METGEELLRVEHVSKSFGAVVALADVNMRLWPGEVLGIIGDNGAGKSTLIKIICGFHRPDGGRIVLEGREVQFNSPADARAAGIETVYQDLALINDLNVFHNMFLKREKVKRLFGVIPLLDDGAMRRTTEEYLRQMKVNIPTVDAPVNFLSGGQRQAVAVARSLYHRPKILILDEPLAAMGAKEARMILDLLLDMKRTREVSIILIAHNYLQVFEVCDRINWVAQGRILIDRRTADASVEEIMNLVISEYRGEVV